MSFVEVIYQLADLVPVIPSIIYHREKPDTYTV